jgi:hypothetical protein
MRLRVSGSLVLVLVLFPPVLVAPVLVPPVLTASVLSHNCFNRWTDFSRKKLKDCSLNWKPGIPLYFTLRGLEAPSLTCE